jgi:hypothetical protein
MTVACLMMEFTEVPQSEAGKYELMKTTLELMKTSGQLPEVLVKCTGSHLGSQQTYGEAYWAQLAFAWCC